MKIKTRTLDINLNGKLIKKDFRIPASWSDRAATIVASKYATDDENSAIDIIDRVVEQIGRWGWAQGYFNNTNELFDDKEARTFKENLRDILIGQRAAFNSPVWFNCGAPSGSDQMSACFIFPVEDSIEDILDHNTREGLVFRAGSGAGVNVSKLRAKGEKLSNKGYASGPVGFMKVWDSNAGSIKSGGKNRRSAKMVCMDIDHPDIEEFINCKQVEEKKAKILIANGVDAEEAYATVAFQNTNHSIRVTNEFMQAYKSNSNWDLINRGNGQIAKKVKARKLLKDAAEIAWATGDPGIQFDDAMNDDNPVPANGRINSTNPCSEFSAIDNSSCNLASLNLLQYWGGEEDGFDWALFKEDIFTMVTAMDILIDAADYPTKEVREITTKTRPLGLGFTNLGAYLMIRGIPYSSEEARVIAADVSRVMTIHAYECSSKLAQKLGSFEYFKKNEDTCRHIANRLTGNNYNVDEGICKVGLRNSQLTLLAPTGTISFMMDCDSTGIEPLFALKSIKTLAGGGTMEIEPKCVAETCIKLDESTDIIYPSNKEIIEAFPNIFSTANDIHWKDHILMMAACQKHLNGAISKTINMPVDATVDDVLEAYLFAWDCGLKAVAIYRDGCKANQPLQIVTDKEDVKVELPQEEKWTPVRRKMPETRYGPTHKFNISGFKGYLTTNTYDDGSLGEIFINASKQGSQMQGILDQFATAISLALQYGVPLEKLVDKFKFSRFEPNGFTTNERIRICTSVVDYVFKWIELEFLDVEEIELVEHDKIESKPMPVVVYDGPSCPVCGGITQRSGTCHTCLTCAATTGCS